MEHFMMGFYGGCGLLVAWGIYQLVQLACVTMIALTFPNIFNNIFNKIHNKNNRQEVKCSMISSSPWRSASVRSSS